MELNLNEFSTQWDLVLREFINFIFLNQKNKLNPDANCFAWVNHLLIGVHLR